MCRRRPVERGRRLRSRAHSGPRLHDGRSVVVLWARRLHRRRCLRVPCVVVNKGRVVPRRGQRRRGVSAQSGRGQRLAAACDGKRRHGPRHARGCGRTARSIVDAHVRHIDTPGLEMTWSAARGRALTQRRARTCHHPGVSLIRWIPKHSRWDARCCPPLTNVGLGRRRLCTPCQSQALRTMWRVIIAAVRWQSWNHALDGRMGRNVGTKQLDVSVLAPAERYAVGPSWHHGLCPTTTRSHVTTDSIRRHRSRTADSCRLPTT